MFKVSISPSFRVPLVYCESNTLSDKQAQVCRYEASVPITGQWDFTNLPVTGTEETQANGGYHYTTGSFAINVKLQSDVTDANAQFDITYDPVCMESLVTSYKSVQTGLNSNTCRIVGFFSNYSTYGNSPYCDLGTFHIVYTRYIDVAIEPDTFITITPSMTDMGDAMYFPTLADPYTSIAGQITSALNSSLELDDIINVLHSIYMQDYQMFTSILSYIDQVEVNQNSIITLLNLIKAQDLAFYNDVRQYLSAKQEEASEAAQEATRVQEEASQIASEMAQTQPDISEALAQLDEVERYQSQYGRRTFYFISGPVLTVLIIAVSLATISYILFGRKN